VDDGGAPTIVYTGLSNDGQRPCVAVGDSDLGVWRKEQGNPVIAEPPAGLDLTGFRDHCVWRESGEWRQIIGSGIRGVGGTALLYRSSDLRGWEYLGPLLVGDAAVTKPVWTGTMWECVDLFGLDGKHVLAFSVWDEGTTHYSAYFTGRYAKGRFEPDAIHVLDHGLRYFYAPQTLRDASGRRIVFGWLQEGRPEHAQIVAGWSGVMSLPRVLTLSPSGGLGVRPAAEVESLRRDRVTVPAMPLGDLVVLDGVSGDQLDIEATFEVALAHGWSCMSAPRPEARSGPSSRTRRPPGNSAWSENTPAWTPTSMSPSAVDILASLRGNGCGCGSLSTSRCSRSSPTTGSRSPTASIRYARTRSRSQWPAPGAPAKLTVLDAWRMTSIWPAPMTS
jgi:hypothetical protein